MFWSIHLLSLRHGPRWLEYNNNIFFIPTFTVAPLLIGHSCTCLLSLPFYLFYMIDSTRRNSLAISLHPRLPPQWCDVADKRKSPWMVRLYECFPWPSMGCHNQDDQWDYVQPCPVTLRQRATGKLRQQLLDLFLPAQEASIVVWLLIHLLPWDGLSADGSELMFILSITVPYP